MPLRLDHHYALQEALSLGSRELNFTLGLPRLQTNVRALKVAMVYIKSPMFYKRALST